MPYEDRPLLKPEQELLDLWAEFSHERFAASFIGVAPSTVVTFAGWLVQRRGGAVEASLGGIVPGWQAWDLLVDLTLLAGSGGPRRSPELDYWAWRPHHYVGWYSESGPVVFDCGVCFIGTDELAPGQSCEAWVRFFEPVWVLALGLGVGQELDLREGGKTPVARATIRRVS